MLLPCVLVLSLIIFLLLLVTISFIMQALAFFGLVLKHCVLSSISKATASIDVAASSLSSEPITAPQEPAKAFPSEPITAPSPKKRSEPSSGQECASLVDETKAPPAKKKKPNVMWLHDIFKDLRTGKVLYDSDSCLPENVIIGRIPATRLAPVWAFYRKLATPMES